MRLRISQLGGPWWPRAALLLALALPTSCAHPSNNFAQELAQVAYPSWVLRGSGPAKINEERSFFGVGQVAGMRNVALARSTADNRARAELARSFEQFAAGVLAAYANQQEAQDAKVPGDTKAEAGPQGGVTLVAKPSELSSEQLVKVLAAAALPGVQVVEHWFHPDDGAVFSLARLELATLVDNLSRMRELRPQLRTWLQGHLELQHDLLCEQKDQQDKTQGQLPG